MGRLIAARRDGMDIHIEQRRRRVVQADLATRLLARLAQRGQMHETAVTRLRMAAGLQPAAQLGVVQERDLARIDIDHQRARGEVRFVLMA